MHTTSKYYITTHATTYIIVSYPELYRITRIIVGISMPAEATSGIVGKVPSVPSDGPSEINESSHARMNIMQKPTYADIVREIESTARRKYGHTIS